MENLDAVYEVEAYQATFKESAVANKWLEARRKLLEDAGLTVVQYSCLQVSKEHFNANIQASRGERPSNGGF